MFRGDLYENPGQRRQSAFQNALERLERSAHAGTKGVERFSFVFERSLGCDGAGLYRGNKLVSFDRRCLDNVAAREQPGRVIQEMPVPPTIVVFALDNDNVVALERQLVGRHRIVVPKSTRPHGSYKPKSYLSQIESLCSVVLDNMAPRRMKAPIQRFEVPYELTKSWKSLHLNPVESESNYMHHARRMKVLKSRSSAYGKAIDNSTPRTMKSPPPFARDTARPATAKRRPEERPASAPRSRPPHISDKLYKLNDKQQQVYDNFTQLLAEFDGYIMAGILEDAKRDAKAKSMLQDYSGPAQQRRR